MYVPKIHEETDISVLHSLVKSHPLATWVTQGDGELLVNHIPFFLDQTRGEFGTRGNSEIHHTLTSMPNTSHHVARAAAAKVTSALLARTLRVSGKRLG